MVDQTPKPPAGFQTIHSRAADLVENDPTFAYAISNQLRKRATGRGNDVYRQEMVARVVFGMWNSMIELEHQRGSPKYMQHFLEMLSDSLIVGFDLLMDKYR